MQWLDVGQVETVGFSPMTLGSVFDILHHTDQDVRSQLSHRGDDVKDVGVGVCGHVRVCKVIKI